MSQLFKTKKDYPQRALQTYKDITNRMSLNNRDKEHHFEVSNRVLKNIFFKHFC